MPHRFPSQSAEQRASGPAALASNVELGSDPSARRGAVQDLLQEWMMADRDKEDSDLFIVAPEKMDATYLLEDRPTGLSLEPPQELNMDDMPAQPTTKRKTSQKQLERSKRKLNLKIANGLSNRVKVIGTRIVVGALPITSTGWAGVDMNRRTQLEWLQQAWEKRTIAHIMLNELRFAKISYEKATPVFLVDEQGTAYAYRSSIFDWMFRVENGTTFMDRLISQNEEYIWKRCGDRDTLAIKANLRGCHWYNVIGVDRQNKPAPALTQFHRNFYEETEWLLQRGGPTDILIRLASSIFEQRFPSLVKRVRHCAECLKLMDEPFARYAEPMFGYWYNYCINGARVGAGVDGVMTRPHVDGKNLALMMCVVFVYGNFNYKEKAWLVLWEANVIIELPPGVFLFYPSSLFTHFNVDICDAQFYTTKGGEYPTRENTSPLNGVPGRGSIVFFNQATMFQLAEKGMTVAQGRAAGKDMTCDNNPFIADLPVPPAM
ncbi:hypothetical protein L226DRAFT_539921 [Lentinus tigrinus ALCF2SS1-7]|uniref:uncharacterized protein n=1 Tax=Lentinus tigrinus ALCF2SS1-7 TaxID=1328758 RepID=UPI001165E4EA|nr:hypothetical protein L226DRAFT_539921 [Lentinus tigrinus ALCF2SS1-7]